jgi:hypothetical protein
MSLIQRIETNISAVLRAYMPPRQGGMCLYIAHAVASVLHGAGMRPVIQAGSLQWPRMRRDEDDGVCNTHFAYMWTPGDPASRLAVSMGQLPEMHVWVGLLQEQQIVDFSTRNLRAEANRCGLTWTAEDPPPYLWTHELPDWVAYTPDRQATLFACRAIVLLFHPAYLERT